MSSGTAERGKPALGPDHALLSARVVAAALLVSGATAAVIGTVLTLPDAELMPERDYGSLLFFLWVASAIGATAGWWMLWRRAAGLATEPRARVEIEAGRLHPGLVLTRLIAGWALLEGQLMIALAVSILGRTPMLLVPSLTVFAIGILLSFPRREWFVPFARGPREPLPPAR